MKIQISLFLFLVLFSTLYIGNAHAQSFSGGFSAYNPDPPFDLDIPPIGPVLAQTGTSPDYSPDFKPLEIRFETVYGVPVLIQSGTIPHQDPILIHDPASDMLSSNTPVISIPITEQDLILIHNPDGPASDILPPVTEVPEWIPHESASDTSTYLPVIPQVTPLPEGTSIESVIDSALDENAPEWIDPLTVRPESPQVTQPGPQIVIPNPYFIDSNMPVEQLNAKLEIILELLDSDLTSEGAFVSPPGVGEDGKMEYVDPLDMRSVPRLGVEPYVAPNIEIVQIATPIDAYTGKEIEVSSSISVPSTDPVKTKKFIEFITDYANDLIDTPTTLSWTIQKVKDTSDLIDASDNIGFVIISLINKQADIKKTLDEDRILTPLQRYDLNNINKTMKSLLESIEQIELDLIKEKIKEHKDKKKDDQSKTEPPAPFDGLNPIPFEGTTPSPLSWGTVTNTQVWPDQCRIWQTNGMDDNLWWFNAYLGETVCMNIKKSGGYSLVIDYDNDGNMDGCDELLCNFYATEYETVYDILSGTQFDSNQDGWFGPGDYKWEYARAWEHDTGKLLTMDSLYIKAFNLSVAIDLDDDYTDYEAWKDPARNGIGQYSDCVYEEDWAYQRAVDQGWSCTPTSETAGHERIVAYNPYGVLYVTGGYGETRDYVVGFWSPEQVANS